jgi:hypothetical protein
VNVDATPKNSQVAGEEKQRVESGVGEHERRPLSVTRYSQFVVRKTRRLVPFPG